jgi:hypothetical protein
MSQKEKAKESSQVRRARRKLRKRMSEEDESITPDTLTKVMASIYRWLERHSSERISLKDRAIVKYDENGKNAAFSDSISHLRNRLMESETSIESEEAPNPLAGRIQKGFSSDT